MEQFHLQDTAYPFAICKDGQTVCSSTLPNGGYPLELLRQMERDGYRIYGKVKTKNKE